jgi:hypothetical protein
MNPGVRRHGWQREPASLIVAAIAVLLAGCGAGSPATPAAATAAAATPSAGLIMPAATTSASVRPPATPTAAATPAATRSAAPPPTEPTSQIDPALGAAIAFVRDDTRLLAFTNWAAVLDGRDATAAADPASVLLALNKTMAFPAAELVSYASRLRATWAFDISDLVWEADLDGNGGPFTVLQFADSIDLSPVVALLDQRGYAHAAQVGEWTIYTHRLDPTQQWLTQGPLQMLNVAVFPSAHRLVMGTSPDLLASVLGPGDSTAAPVAGPKAAEVRALAATLGAPYGALFSAEAGACRSFGAGPVLATPSASSSAAPASAPPAAIRVSATLGTAIGFSAVAGAPPVIAALLYPDAATAAADIPGRTALAAAAISVTGAPYATAVMSMSKVRTVGSVLLLDGVPRDDRPQVVVNAWSRRDLPFAACP